jgi:flavorubredoxin
LDEIINVYAKWAAYEPEEKDGVLIVYGSIYGGTANAAEVLARELALRNVKNIALYDVSKTDSSVLVGEAFRVGTILLLSSTYNLGVFQKMEDYLHDLANHLIKNRTFGIVENGSWSPAASKCMHAILDPLPGNKFLEKTFTIRSVAKEEQLADLKELADQALATLTLE